MKASLKSKAVFTSDDLWCRNSASSLRFPLVSCPVALYSFTWYPPKTFMPSRFTKERFPSGCSTGLRYFFPVRSLETVSRNIGSTTRLGMKLAYWLAGTSRTGLGKQHVVNVLTRYEIKKLPLCMNLEQLCFSLEHYRTCLTVRIKNTGRNW